MEYAGYVPTPNLNVAGLTSKLAESIYSIETAKQTKRAEMEQMKIDTETAINSQEMTDSQDFNELIAKGADNGRTMLNDLNNQLKSGKIKPSEYRMAVNNIQKNWGILANTAKSFDEQFKEYKKRQEPGANGYPEAAQFELELANRFGKVAELANKDLQFNKRGDLYTINNQSGETWSIDVLNRPENIYQNRFDLPSSVSDIVKGFESWVSFEDLGRGGEKEIDSFYQNTSNKEAIATGVNSMVANPRTANSIYTDWGNVNADYYMNDIEYQQLYDEKLQNKIQAKKDAGLPIELTADEKKEIEMSLIKIEKQGAVINPVLSPDQLKKTKEIVDSFIRSNIYQKVTGKAKEDWSKPASFYNDGSGSGDETPKTNLYEDIRTAWDLSTKGTEEATKESEARLTALTQGKFQFKWDTGGLKVYKLGENKYGKRTKIEIPGTINNLDAAQKYFYPDKNQYDTEKQEYLGKKQGVSKKTAEPKNYTKNQELNIAATMKANKGATREQAIKALGY